MASPPALAASKTKSSPPPKSNSYKSTWYAATPVGVGPLLPERVVRAMLLVRANTLAIGCSGVRPAVIHLLLEMLNQACIPVPSRDRWGPAAIWRPLAHVALVLIGEGEAWHQGEKMNGRAALLRAGLQPLVLEAKEGLALLNGTAFMVGMGALNVRRAINLALTADTVAALSLEALHGTDRAYDERVHLARPHPRQIECAAFLRQNLAGSRLLRQADPRNVQDPYTLRCIPRCMALSVTPSPTPNGSSVLSLTPSTTIPSSL
ncbi:MAG: aromatic amino acid ammonia-lyase [Chloroflexi bacterium]|nr:aromatic amino acid ammonia-lyase [Chloroflexota bacterium]